MRDGIVDDERVAITGSSYGGFLAAWAVTQTDRFAAAIPCPLISDWLSFELTANIRRFVRLYLDGDHRARSPVCEAHRCTTPTLLLHGEDDWCTPLSQSVELYHALVAAGCVTELVVYPREVHSLLEHEHQIDAWRRVRDWLAQHV